MATTLAFALDNPLAILRHHAKSFFWASLFLPRARRLPIAELYAFCRGVDDISDLEAATPAREQLLALRDQVAMGRFGLSLRFERQGLKRSWLIDLIDGALYDTCFRPFATESELELYCYRVAGVVGLMMCPLLGVESSPAWQNAVDLGTAMQLTNIARDVKEDADRGRLYVPQVWLNELGLSAAEVQAGRGADRLVRRLLAKAEPLYRSGRQGLYAIPWRTRLSIAVALEIYRDIGRSLRKQGYDPFRARAYVRRGRKVLLTLAAIWKCLIINREEHDETFTHNLVWRQSDDVPFGTGHSAHEVDL